MQTNFSLAQLANPDLKAAEKILRSCVHCGFCLATCPTYQILGDERDSPRGRIYLIKDMLENDRPADATAARHIDRCLSCLSCMTTCPSGVDYMHLVDHARERVEETWRRPWHDRLLRDLLVRVMTRPSLMRAALVAGALPARALGWVPGRLGAMARIARRSAAPPSWVDRPQTFHAEGKARRRVALLSGCVQQVMAPDINEATVRLLTRLGCDVTVIAGFGCCGALPHHMGRREDALSHVRANLQALNRAEAADGAFDAFVSTASGCGTTLKDYGVMLARDEEFANLAVRFADIVRDVSELVAEIGLSTPLPEVAALRVAYHPPCSLQHGQQVRDAPKALLAAAGFEVLDIPDSHLCCGSAGTYNILQPDLARGLQRRKADNIARVQPDLVATGNIGCQIQIDSAVDVPVVHTVHLLDWATGGPAPAALGNQFSRPTERG